MEDFLYTTINLSNNKSETLGDFYETTSVGKHKSSLGTNPG